MKNPLTEVAPAQPRWLVLGVNNVCNLKCRMCDVGLGDGSTVFWANLVGKDPRNMSEDLFREVLRQAAELRPLPRVGFAFTEPLLHPRIADFARASVAGGFHTSLTTNATPLARHADAFVEMGLHELHVSLDGPPEVHDAIRGGRDTWKRIARGLDALAEAKARRGAGLPRLGISFTVTDRNAAHVLELVKAVEPYRPAVVNVSQLNFITGRMAAAHNARFDGPFAVTRSNLGPMEPAAMDTGALFEELVRVKAWAAERGASAPPLTFVPEVTTREALDLFYREELTFVGGRRCTDPWTMLMVRPDGSVIPAHGRCFDYPVGNVRETPLAAIWNGAPFRTFRATLLAHGGTLPACARCCGVIGKPAA